MASCDARTSNVIGIPSLVLMERAALSVADGVDLFMRKNNLCSDRGARPLILALAGRGNNGADALAAGRILIDRGYHVRFVRLSGKISPESSFAVQENILRQYGAEVEEYTDSSILTEMREIPYVIIDGLFGTGLSRELTGEAADCVEAVNRCRDRFGTYVVAVDIPSGVSSDDGSIMGCAVRCDETRTFAFYKRGHFLYPGTEYAGILHLAQIGITQRAFEKAPGMFTIRDACPADILPPRDCGGNKGTFGRILLIAGRRNMCGAALLAARACMSAGAGMVKIFTHEANRLIIQQALPEALLDTFDDTDMPGQISQKLTASLQWADIVAAGPAMGTDDTASDLLKHVLCYSQKEKALKGLVLDADAIRILAKNRELRQLLTDRCPQTPCILTPHMAEFAALAGLSVHDCIRNRTCLVQEQADLLGSVIVCKDARTLVARPSAHTDRDGHKNHENHENIKAKAKAPQYLNVTGNSGMATAGSGDVLTGITAALLALDFKDKKESALSRSVLFFARPECESGFAAAVSAVIIHAAAGDCARDHRGEHAMTAGDLIEELRSPSFWGS